MKKKNNYKKILSKQNQKWFSNFYKKFGRPPHVLHIGNIANNAYNNAKIMNEAGICSDVLCHDYYHIMSNPEWEDADFSKFPGDDFFPDWTKSKIKNFDRPKWFVQGPIRICLMYLLAKKNKKKIESQILWYLLSCFNGTNAVNIFKFLNIINFATLIIKFFVDLIKFFVDLIKSFVIRIAYHFSSLIIIFFSFFIQLVNHIFSIKLLFPKLNLFFLLNYYYFLLNYYFQN